MRNYRFFFVRTAIAVGKIVFGKVASEALASFTRHYSSRLASPTSREYTAWMVCHTCDASDCSGAYHSILHVSDWYKTLVSAALCKDSPEDAAAARKTIAHIFAIGPIDSVDQWSALNGESHSQALAPSRSGLQFAAADGPRTEVLLAGIDSDKRGAAIRVGDYKLIIGDWGADTWCDLNRSGFSPVFPAAPANKPPSEGGGGFGGLVCVALNGTTGPGKQWLQQKIGSAPDSWTNMTRGLFNVETDPREMHDLQDEKPDVVATLKARFLAHNLTTVSSIHLPRDPAGTAHANATDCWSPWERK